MIFCRVCGKQLHESAIACPHCGAPQTFKSGNALVESAASTSSTTWQGIIAMMLATFVFLALFDPNGLDEDEMIGSVMFTVIGMVFGIYSLAAIKHGKTFAAIATVLCFFVMCIAVGMNK